MCFGCDGIAIYGMGALTMIVMKIPPLGEGYRVGGFLNA